MIPYVRLLSRFRDSVRQMARSNVESKELLALCDKLRDVDLPELGVLVDDQDDGRALVKLMDKEELKRLQTEKRAREEEKLVKKQAQLAELERKRQERLEKGKIDPETMFKSNHAEYSAFDEHGVPTHDAKGDELSK